MMVVGDSSPTQTKQAASTLRILSVASSFPYPPNDGTRNRTWNLVEGLSRTEDVTLLTWGPAHPRDLETVKSAVRQVILPPSGAPITGRTRKLELRVRGMSQGLPPYVMERLARYEIPDLNGQFDVAIAEDDSALFLMPRIDCPVVVQRHNIYGETIPGLVASGHLGIARRAKWLAEGNTWRRYDRSLGLRPHLSIVTTEEARAALLRATPGVRVEVVPNGVTIPDVALVPGDAPVAVFLGQMNYEPNVDAVLYFVRRIWPAIRARVPDAEFRVIGRDPLPVLRRLNIPGVTIVGEVADAYEACRGAMAGVVPLQAGSGIKTKTLDLMAMGLPVVATPVGAEGLTEAEGRGLFIGGNEKEFGRAVADLLTEPERAKAHGSLARTFVSQLSWETSVDHYLELLREIATKKDDFHVGSQSRSSGGLPRLRVGRHRARTRVLFINGTGERAGAERMLVHLLSNLDRASYEPVVAFLGKGPFVEEVAALGVRVIQLDDPGRLRQMRKWKRVVESIRAVIRETGAQLVHANGEKMSIYAGRASAAEGVPCISWLHDAPGAGGLSGWMAQLALRRTQIARIVTCARWMERDFNTKLKLGANAIPNCLDLTSLPGQNGSMDAIKEEAGWRKDDVVIAHFARLQRWKGTEVFLKAAAQLAPLHHNVKFLVVGDALFGRELEYASQLREIARDLDLDGKLVFTGFRSDALEIMAESDVVVHSSVKPDPFPLVVLEGMALGRPVVASRTRGPEEAIDHGITGLLTPPGDVPALTVALSNLIESPGLRHRLGYRASSVARKRFSAPLMAYRFESLYQEILDGAAVESSPSRSDVLVPGRVLRPAKA